MHSGVVGSLHFMQPVHGIARPVVKPRLLSSTVEDDCRAAVLYARGCAKERNSISLRKKLHGAKMTRACLRRSCCILQSTAFSGSRLFFWRVFDRSRRGRRMCECRWECLAVASLRTSLNFSSTCSSRNSLL